MPDANKQLHMWFMHTQTHALTTQAWWHCINPTLLSWQTHTRTHLLTHCAAHTQLLPPALDLCLMMHMFACRRWSGCHSFVDWTFPLCLCCFSTLCLKMFTPSSINHSEAALLFLRSTKHFLFLLFLLPALKYRPIFLLSGLFLVTQNSLKKT